METQVVERIRKEVSKTTPEVTKVYKSDYQKAKTMTAEIRQEVTTKSFYPSISIANSHQDNIFGQKEFGASEQEFSNKENRVAFIDVPETMSKEQVAEQLGKYPKATLYRVLSNTPILTDNQVYAINSGLTTKDVIANSQVVRYPKGSVDSQGNSNEGMLALDVNGKPQYRAIFFSNGKDAKGNDLPEIKADSDTRTADMNNVYYSPEIKAEVEGHQVESGQRL